VLVEMASRQFGVLEKIPTCEHSTDVPAEKEVSEIGNNPWFSGPRRQAGSGDSFFTAETLSLKEMALLCVSCLGGKSVGFFKLFFLCPGSGTDWPPGLTHASE
jgi:hypothetical protein